MRQQHRHPYALAEQVRIDEDRACRLDLGTGERIERMPHRIALHDTDRDQVGIAQGVIVIVLVLVLVCDIADSSMLWTSLRAPSRGVLIVGA